MDIVSALPGKVVEVKVTQGQSIAAGDVVLTIEVMKMTQEIVADGGGTVSAVHVEEGQEIMPGQPVVTLE